VFLNFFWEFSEINLRDSGFRFHDDAIGIDTSDSCVFVLLAVNRREILCEGGWCKT